MGSTDLPKICSLKYIPWMEKVAARKKERWHSAQMPRFSRGTAVSNLGHSTPLFHSSLNELWLLDFFATLVCEESSLSGLLFGVQQFVKKGVGYGGGMGGGSSSQPNTTFCANSRKFC